MDFLFALWYYLCIMPLGDLTFLHSGCMPHCTAIVDKYFEGYYTLQFAEQGGVELFYDQGKYILPWGEAWFWPAHPGPHIRFHIQPGRNFWAHRYAAFRGPRVARWIADGLWPDAPQTAPVTNQRDYPARFDELLRLCRLPDPWAVARAVNLLEGLLLELAEERACQRKAASELEPWLAELFACSETAFSPNYAQIARDHALSLSTLRRRFREATGTPLHEWAVQTRIARARDLLGETDMPIKAVAERLGYSDIYFFTRQFRQSVGVPPAAYRKSRQG